ncbi:uncharacterized protein FYW61_006650 [Anableps anableps]
MAEEEVSYASVAFKAKEQPQSQAKNENETVYDEVKVSKEPVQAKTVEDAEVEKQNETVQQTPDKTGLLSDKAAERFHRHQQLACCFGTLGVVSLLSVIGVCVYFATVHDSAARELNQLKSNQQDLLEEIHNLTNLYNNLSSDYENLTVQFDNVTQHNKELREEKKNLTELIKNMEKTWNELNVSRAQWSIDEYCPKESGGRKCASCQNGWHYHPSSCYAYNDAQPEKQTNWEGARENCSTKISDLPVVSNQAEKDYINTMSPVIYGISGYWIGLRAVEGKWKWIDGSDLTNQTWMQQPAADGQCVTSLQNQGWRSVSCDDRNAWICEKKALTV